MAVPTGTFKTYEAIGNREELADMIYDISPTETPFMSNVGRSKAGATFHEWQTDVLADATADNITIEGDDATTNTATATTRLGNYTQLSDKVPRVTRTQDIVNKAGRRKEMSYQIVKRGKEMKRDIEKRLSSTQAAAVGSAGGGRECAGVGAWLWDNQVKKDAAATTVAVTAGAPATDPTAGSAGTFTEANLKTCVAACWNDGGNPNMVLVGSFNKQSASGFDGIATQYRENPQVGPGTIIGAADVYVSDFGTLNIVPSRFSPSNNVYVLDTEFWSVAYLDPIQKKPLAKTGHSERQLMWAEYTLCAKAPSASGKIYTTTTS